MLSPLLFLATMVVLPPVVISSRKFRRDSNVAYLVVRDRIGQTLSTLQESLAGIRVVQAFGREDEQYSRFVDHNQAQYDANVARGPALRLGTSRSSSSPTRRRRR